MMAEDVKLYFVDGYHGGIKGHMPPGAWRDVLQRLKSTPFWKICLDIEPISWDYLRREDPETYEELREYLKDDGDAPRVEMVAGSYAQPYGWVVGGESNIRHLIRGRQILEEHFPGLRLDTYAVQEPCWTSSMPQILLSLGFKRAVLKDPGTAWAGYTTGFDADVVHWVGPDGSSIPCVPRYACEDLISYYETESAHGSLVFAKKCIRHGITKPAGMYYQDLGWAAYPKVRGEHIEYVTWREYFELIAPKPEKEWHFTQEDIRCTLPWGERTLQEMAKQVRSAENRILAAEKMASLAAVFAGMEYPEKELRDAWDQLLLSQHHDAWICAVTREGRNKWAWQAAAETWYAEEISNKVISVSAEALSAGEQSKAGLSGTDERILAGMSGFEGNDIVDRQWFRVFNTLGSERKAVAETLFITNPGAKSVRVLDDKGAVVPSQILPARTYRDDGSINTGKIIFKADIPPIGYSTYSVIALREADGKSGRDSAEIPAISATEQDFARPDSIELDSAQPDSVLSDSVRIYSGRKGLLVMESDQYRITIDTERGGIITSLFDKPAGRELCDGKSERHFNEYRGYFVKEGKWISSTENPVEAKVVEKGPVRATLEMNGSIAGNPFTSAISIALGERRIDFGVRFHFKEETWIGDPYDVSDDRNPEKRRRSHHDDSYKLQAFFPTNLRNQKLYKNAAYDVCLSRNEDTFFKGWHEIKSNIILNWVDIYDEESDYGMALLSDHTTSYAHGRNYPLALVLGWGWEAGFWWGKCPLKGKQEVKYSVIPHDGRWDKAGISAESASWNEPLIVQRITGIPKPGEFRRSLLSVESGGIEVPTIIADGDDLLIRLFNAEGDDKEHLIRFNVLPEEVDLVELDGRFVRKLDIERMHGIEKEPGFETTPGIEKKHGIETNPGIEGASDSGWAGGTGRSGCSVRLEIPRFGLRTLRLRGVCKGGR